MASTVQSTSAGWDPFSWIFSEVSKLVFGASEAELALVEEKEWDEMEERDIETLIQRGTDVISTQKELLIRDGRGARDGFNARRYILIQSKVARLCEHNRHLHTVSEVMKRYNDLLKAAALPAVKAGLSEFDSSIIHATASASQRLATLESKYATEAAELKLAESLEGTDAARST